jgi:SAM-dependent methyltransferase
MLATQNQQERVQRNRKSRGGTGLNGSKSNGNSRNGNGRAVSMASLADKYDLYLKSVQSPDHEAWFFQRIYKSLIGKKPRVLREDFCGTAAVCCEWVNRHPERRAIGVDLDPEPLAWGREHNLAKLPPAAQARVDLQKADARAVRGPKADIVTAQNFSFYLFMTRDELRAYFRAAYRNLGREGIFVLDMMGGPECMEEDLEETKSFRGFKYIWNQISFDPISHHAEFAIHFRFPDGSEQRRAFSYKWRLWTIPEVRELLAEAGFERSVVYWEDTDSETGEGNDTYRPRERASSEATWICYLVGVK